MRRRFDVSMKRGLDIIFSLSGLLFLTPIFFFLAILIKFDSPGPVFYRGVRIGKNGRPFRIFKFRTMVVNAERLGGASTPVDDPRITKIGKFIRKYNLDELPQFINVLKGEMSIIGPRPDVKYYIDMLTPEEKVILSVRPGITDLATVWIRNEGELLKGKSDAEKVYLEKIRPQKLRLQLDYIKNHSIALDFKVMLQTLKVHLLDRIMNKRS